MKDIFARQETWLTMLLIAIAGIIGGVNPDFLSMENACDILAGSAFLGILAVGVFLVLVAGEIDISFTATATVAQYVSALVVIEWGGGLGAMLLVAVLIGTLLGAINAGLVHCLRIPSIIATIATLNITFGLLMFFTDGRQIVRMPDWFNAIATATVVPLGTTETPYGLNLGGCLFIGIAMVTLLACRYTMLGRSLYALGGSQLSAERVGLSVGRLRLVVFGLMGVLAGIAGVVMSLRTQMVNPNAIVGKELDVYAAVVLGGASLKGGQGSVLGTVLGVALIAVLANGMTLMHIPSVWYQVAIGLIIIISIVFNAGHLRAGPRRSIAGEAA